MAIDKAVDSARLNSALGATADAIRAKTGESASIAFDSATGFADAIAAIPAGAGWETAPESWAAGMIDRTLSGSVYGSMVLSIRGLAFLRCTQLTGVEFPECRTIGTSAFASCSALTTVSFPVCTMISEYAFRECRVLTTVSFPACTMINSDAFRECSALTTVSFPACTAIYSRVFYSCSALTTVSFPVCTTIGEYAFSGCRALTTASFPACTRIENAVFSNCVRLISLYLTGSLICTLSSTYAFTSTPIGGYSASAGQFGSIYVPASLLASYKAATNWAYFSSRFVGV